VKGAAAASPWRRQLAMSGGAGSPSSPRLTPHGWDEPAARRVEDGSPLALRATRA
jgi:hypothetical protein